MKETKPNTPVELSVQSQDINDEELDEVAGGMLAEEEDLQEKPSITGFVARTVF